MTSSVDALVLNARLRQALVTIRSLGRRGIAVAAVDSESDLPAYRSRWCHDHFVCPPVEATSASLAFLEELLDRVDPAVLIPGHDGTIAMLREHRGRLASRVAVALAQEPALAIAVSKQRTLALAGELGIAVPRSLSLNSVGELPAALKEIGLPAVVKPTQSWLSDGHGAEWIGPELVTTPDEARRAVARVERLGGAALFQRLLLGRREAVSFLYANGEIHARFAQWAKRMNPPLGGESVLRQSISIPPDIGRAAERLVREIDLEGYSEVEFRRDGEGVPHLMEINPRLSASVEIAVRSGVDFPYLLYQWANGWPIDRVRDYRVGRWMRYLQGDWTATIRALEQAGRPGVPTPLAAAVGFGLSFLRPMRYDYVDWWDPAPGVKAMTDFAREVVGTAGRVARRIGLLLMRRVAWTSRTT
jgi:predicted ATP-grasp superfamily ATP-dependent carboligase